MEPTTLKGWSEEVASAFDAFRDNGVSEDAAVALITTMLHIQSLTNGPQLVGGLPHQITECRFESTDEKED